jgi:DNA-binding response OmpR family regulator
VASAEHLAKKRILVAEDDPEIRTLLVKALSRDYEMTAVADGLSALAHATAEKLPPPNLIILDIMMPRLDGLGVARRLRLLPEHKHTPIIFLTAKDAPLDIVRGIQAGARYYIMKPFALSELLAKVRKALGQ